MRDLLEQILQFAAQNWWVAATAAVVIWICWASIGKPLEDTH